MSEVVSSSRARGDAGERRFALTRSLASSVPVVTAVMLGVLYGLGVMLTATELIGARLPVTATLPLIPLQEHLTKGLGALFSSPLLAAVAGIGYVGGLAAVAWFRRMMARVDELDVLAERARKEAETLDADGSQAILDDLRARGAALSRDVETAETAEDLKSVKERYKTLSEDVDRIGEQTRDAREKMIAIRAIIDESDTKLSHSRASLSRQRRLMGWFHVVQKLIAVGIGVAALFSPATFAWGQVALAAGLWWYSEQEEPPYLPVWAAFFFGAVMLPYVVNAYVNPTPLPTATLVTATGTVKGGLITSSSDRYVITKAPHTFQTYPAGVVKSADSRTHARPRSASVLTLIGRVFD